MLSISIKKLFKGLYRRCACGCNYLIPVINKTGNFARYKNGHNPIDHSKISFPKRENHHNYKGGISKMTDKYLGIRRPHHKFVEKNGYVLLHRYRMELMIGRYLTEEEVVHHIDGNGHNNEESNLRLFVNQSEHIIFELTKDMSKRSCKICGSKKTQMKKKKDKLHAQWYGNEIDGFVCRNCHNREYIKNKKFI